MTIANDNRNLSQEPSLGAILLQAVSDLSDAWATPKTRNEVPHDIELYWVALMRLQNLISDFKSRQQ